MILNEILMLVKLYLFNMNMEALLNNKKAKGHQITQ